MIDVEDLLSDLAGPAPSTLIGRVFTGHCEVAGRLGPVQVAFTATGVQFLRPGDPDEFARAYRARFGRPLRPAPRPPAGVLPTLRSRPTTDLRLDLTELSDFERAVLTTARRIPSGQTRPYAWVAREAGRPGASRAVGTVLARNPVPLLVPCHRVVRADGAVGDYMFGTGAKERLLRAEGVDLDAVTALARTGVRYLASDTTGIVCFPTCRDARRITPAHRHGFGSLPLALAAGYRPCRTCTP